MQKLDHYLTWLLISLISCLVFSFLIVALDGVFVLIFPPKIINLSPSDGAQGVPLRSSLVINFDKPVKRQEVQLTISPQTHGEWKFKDPLIEDHLYRTLVFIPAIELEPGIQYQVEVENIKGFGFEKISSFQFTFKTRAIVSQAPETEIFTETESKIVKPENKVTMLEIALDWQDHPLSCEAASLKMALIGKGIFVSENEIMEKIGYDLIPHKGNIWGNPYEKYVGDINGKMCETGYGVYWEPVAKAAQSWRAAEAFSGWGVKVLTSEIEAGNPVIVWGVLPTGNLTDCSWYTPEGEYIAAIKETHVRLVIGFIGSQTNPSKIILNDPLAGRLYWSTTYFLENWKAFDYSGVVVR